MRMIPINRSITSTIAISPPSMDLSSHLSWLLSVTLNRGVGIGVPIQGRDSGGLIGTRKSECVEAPEL
jgi:hypothetical protein